MLLFLFAIAFGTSEGKTKSEHELLHDRLVKMNDALLSAVEELSKSDTTEGEGDDGVDRTVLGPAWHCMDLKQLPVSFDAVNGQYPCLKDFCNSIKTMETCLLDENYHHGCSWCGGQCQPYFSYQKAFTQCVVEAYADHDPDKVNGISIQVFDCGFLFP